MNRELQQSYFDEGFKALRCRGYHPKHNPAKIYKSAKIPVDEGYTKGGFRGLSISEIEAWENQGGWVGWVIPEGTMAIDAEGLEKLTCIDLLYKKKSIQPPLHVTNKGRHDFFRDNGLLKGASEVFTKSGLPVTYRTGGKNQLILAPTNGRSWARPFLKENLPSLPDALMPYDRQSITDVMSNLSWQIGEAYRAKALSGNGDIDLAYLSFLIQAGIEEKQIHNSLALIFLSEYDQRRTQDLIQRSRAKLEAGERILGAGSFIHQIKDREDLKNVLRFAKELQLLTGTGHKTPWSDPIPLTNHSALPDFPVDALPKLGAEMVRTVSEVNQVDPGLSATIYLSLLASCLQKKTEIDLITHREPLNIFTCSILPPGERKTSTASVFTIPIYEYQAQKQAELVDKIRKATGIFKIKEARLARVQKQAANSDDFTERKRYEDEALEIAKDMAENPIPKTPLFLCDDITAEALGILMAENNEKMGVFSTEGGIFEIMAGRYNDKNGNFDLYLKGHSGDPWSSHRVGREAKGMQKPALTMCLTVQPEVVTEIGGNRLFRGKGLLARFLFQKGKPQAGNRKRQIKSIPISLLERYRNHIFNLLDLHPAEQHLRFSTGAQKLWDEFYEDIEKEMASKGDLEDLKDWGSKLPGAVARIAGLLHLAEHGTRGFEIPISETFAGFACVIGAYFKEHALAVFDFMRLDGRVETAKRVLGFIENYKPGTFKGRDIFNHTNLKTMADINPGLVVLMERGYIREVKPEYTGTGRPEAVTYEVNPKMLGNHPQNQQK